MGYFLILSVDISVAGMNVLPFTALYSLNPDNKHKKKYFCWGKEAEVCLISKRNCQSMHLLFILGHAFGLVKPTTKKHKRSYYIL